MVVALGHWEDVGSKLASSGMSMNMSNARSRECFGRKFLLCMLIHSQRKRCRSHNLAVVTRYPSLGWRYSAVNKRGGEKSGTRISMNPNQAMLTSPPLRNYGNMKCIPLQDTLGKNHPNSYFCFYPKISCLFTFSKNKLFVYFSQKSVDCLLFSKNRLFVSL